MSGYTETTQNSIILHNYWNAVRLCLDYSFSTSVAVFHFGQSDYTVAENQAFLNVCIMTNASVLARDAIVALGTQDSTAKGKLVVICGTTNV